MGYKDIYDASWTTPLPAIVAPCILLLYLLFFSHLLKAFLETFSGDANDLSYKRAKIMRLWLYFFLVETILDATFGSLSALLSTLFPWLPSTGIVIAFVVLGDFRVYFVVMLFKVPSLWLAIVLALLLCLPGPTSAAYFMFTGSYASQTTWLAHESVSIGVIFLLILFVLPSLPSRTSYFLRPLLLLFLLHYFLWAASDLLILNKLLIGWLLRLVPNFLYYNVTIPLVYLLYFRSSTPAVTSAAL